MGTMIGRINQILRGWTNYFRHAVCKHTLNRGRLRLLRTCPTKGVTGGAGSVSAGRMLGCRRKWSP